MIELFTARLALKPLSMEDIDGLLDIGSDPIAMEHYPQVYNRDECIAWIEKSQKRFEEHGHGFMSCYLKETGEFTGICGLLRQLDWGHGRDENEVGYLFRRKFWKQGLATEAAIRCKRWGYEEFGYTRIVSLINPRNESSIRVAKRNGMTLEQVIPAERCKYKEDIQVWVVELD